MLPYILSELRDLSTPEEEPRHVVQGYAGDIADLLSELLTYRPAPAPAARGGARHGCRPGGVLRLVDAAPDQRQLHRRQSHPGRPSILQQLRRELGELSRPDLAPPAGSGFAVNVDVQDYRPEELSVQVTKDDGFVVVEGCHEERADEHGVGYVRRQFTRRYKLPAGVDPDTITSRLTPEGVLQVSAPIKALNAPQERVRQVPITCSKQPVLQQHAHDEEKGHGDPKGEHVDEKQKEADSKEDAQAQNESK